MSDKRKIIMDVDTGSDDAVALVMAILPTLAESLVPELAQKFISGSKLLNVAQRFDLLNAAGEVRRLMMGG